MAPEGRRRLSTEYLLVLITAAAGLVGVLAGGGITYVTSRAIQAREIREEDRIFARAARGAAALEYRRLTEIRGVARAAVDTRINPRLDEARWRSELSVEDKSRLLAQLELDELDAYLQAEDCAVRIQRNLGLLRPLEPVGRDIRRAVESFMRCVDGGRRVLRPLLAGA